MYTQATGKAVTNQDRFQRTASTKKGQKHAIMSILGAAFFLCVSTTAMAQVKDDPCSTEEAAYIRASNQYAYWCTPQPTDTVIHGGHMHGTYCPSLQSAVLAAGRALLECKVANLPPLEPSAPK